MDKQNGQVTILSSLQVDQKINRISRQILENYHDEKEIVLVGIAKRGYKLAERIDAILTRISENKITLASLSIHKDKPLSEECRLSLDTKHLNGKVVIVVDDVLNSGRTLIYACKYLLDFTPRKMKTVVLVDRKHRKFPVRADFVGLTLSTTLEEHISVDFEKDHVILA